ncbi:hypothetical protein AB0J35_21600 [Nonomuraea angiospora]|uniref:hypothetical protein n=1 Tax=Nonomuraea angiospora TaxID=46172 RepID=UPI00342829F0
MAARPSGDDRAAALDEHAIAPATAMAADALAGADDPPEPGPGVQVETGGVLREDSRLDRPDPPAASVETIRAASKVEPTPVTASAGMDVDRVLHHSGVGAPVGDRGAIEYEVLKPCRPHARTLVT